MFDILLPHLEHPNPVVRYSTIHTFGQLADDLKEHFAVDHAEIVFEKLIPMINDPVPRVAGHAYSGLENVTAILDKERVL